MYIIMSGVALTNILITAEPSTFLAESRNNADNIHKAAKNIFPNQESLHLQESSWEISSKNNAPEIHITMNRKIPAIISKRGVPLSILRSTQVLSVELDSVLFELLELWELELL